MKVTKKTLGFLLIGIAAIVLTALSAEAADKAVAKLGHHHNVGGVVDQYTHKLADLAREKSGGSLEIQVFPAAQLGQERDATEGVMMGTMDITTISSPNLYGYFPAFGLDALPFLFDSFEEVNRVFDGPIGKEFEARLLEHGGRILGWLVFGGRDMIFVSKKITTFDEMRGLKMRSPENDVYIGMFQALRCKPTAVTWGEAYTAMQTGLVDGMESPPSGTRDMNFFEVARYALRTQHIWGTFNLIVNENFFQSLSPEHQKVLIESANEATIFARKIAKDADEEALEFIKSKGVQVVELSEEERDKFRQACQPFVEDWAKKHQATEFVAEIYRMKSDTR